MKYRIVKKGKVIVKDMESFVKRSEALYHFLNKYSSKVTFKEVHKDHPELGSIDSILRLSRHLERLGLVDIEAPKVGSEGEIKIWETQQEE